jgi:hypothetical protein
MKSLNTVLQTIPTQKMYKRTFRALWSPAVGPVLMKTPIETKESMVVRAGQRLLTLKPRILAATIPHLCVQKV